MPFEQEILSFIGKVVAYGGGSAAIAFLFFRFLGKNWIEQKFAERLEAYKHAQIKELEEVKFQINSLFSQVTKLHEKEFDVLPNIWAKVNIAHAALIRCTLRYSEHPDFDKISNEELEGYLKGSEFSESEKNMMRQSSGKNQIFSKIATWRQIVEAQEAFNKFNSYFIENRIFLNRDLKTKFENINQLMWKLWVANKVGESSGNGLMALNGFEECDEPIKNLMKEIEELVQGRLYPLENKNEKH